MKNIFIYLLGMLCSLASYAQNSRSSFLITGIIEDAKTDSILIYEGATLIAKASMTNNSFSVKGKVTEPKQVSLFTKVEGHGPDELKKVGRLILENASYTIVVKNQYAKIKGGKLQDRVLGFESSDEYQHAVMDYEKTVKNLVKDKKEGEQFGPEERKIAREKINVAIEIENNKLREVIEDPNSSPLTKAFALGRTQDWENYSLENRLILFDGYKSQSKKDAQVIEKLKTPFANMKKANDLQKTVDIGKPYKNIQAKDSEGHVIQLAEVISKNKFTILEFWASWCSPCRGEIPNLKKAYAKYKNKGLEIYSISLDEKQEKWLQALKEEDTPWINVVDTLGFKGAASNDYGVMGVPTSFLITQDGKIIAISEELRGAKLDETLGKYLN